ncbi:hypothetical protein BC829DRAFT_403569 [Chytridium lagenaria]|nr:hypothetical protein BC829DRAFT_403569 [Chytridium lagenaria]
MSGRGSEFGFFCCPVFAVPLFNGRIPCSTGRSLFHITRLNTNPPDSGTLSQSYRIERKKE